MGRLEQCKLPSEIIALCTPLSRCCGRVRCSAIDAGGHVDTAIWGEVMTVAAQSRGVAAVVLDGAVRDAAKMREMNFTIFACGVVPRGPHKGLGGTIDGPVSVGGVTVYPGDLLIGDDDGVAVVPLASIDTVLKEVQRIESRETQMLDAI